MNFTTLFFLIFCMGSFWNLIFCVRCILVCVTPHAHSSMCTSPCASLYMLPFTCMSVWGMSICQLRDYGSQRSLIEIKTVWLRQEREMPVSLPHFQLTGRRPLCTSERKREYLQALDLKSSMISSMVKLVDSLCK